jgi:hypothetical protein
MKTRLAVGVVALAVASICGAAFAATSAEGPPEGDISQVCSDPVTTKTTEQRKVKGDRQRRTVTMTQADCGHGMRLMGPIQYSAWR